MKIMFLKLTPVWDEYDIEIDEIVDFLFEVYSFKKFGNDINEIDKYIDILLQYFKTHIEYIFKELHYLDEKDYIESRSYDPIYDDLKDIIKETIKEKIYNLYEKVD